MVQASAIAKIIPRRAPQQAQPARDAPSITGKELFAKHLDQQSLGDGQKPVASRAARASQTLTESAALQVKPAKNETEASPGRKNLHLPQDTSSGQQTSYSDPESAVSPPIPYLTAKATSVWSPSSEPDALAHETGPQSGLVTEDAQPRGSSIGASSAKAFAGSFPAVLERQTHLAPEPQYAVLRQARNLEAVNAGAAPVSARDSSNETPIAGNANPMPDKPAKEAAIAGRGLLVSSVPANEELSNPLAAATAPAAGAGQATPALPLQQILDAITAAESPGQAAQSATKPEAPALVQQQAVKSVTLALDPAGLGTVAIVLSLKGAQLGIAIKASEAGTAQLIRRDNTELSDMLRSAGYSVETLSIEHLTPGMSSNLASAHMQPDGQSSSSFLDASGGGERRSGRGDGNGNGASSNKQEQRDVNRGQNERVSRDSALYI